MNDKKIAVFIPCYNSVSTVEATIQSIGMAIEAMGVSVPVHLYDDCSRDNSVEVARAAWKGPEELIVHRNSQNLGERKTTNDAFHAFEGEYDWVFIIHADDIVKKDWLTKMYDQIRQVDDEKCFTVWSSFDSMDGATGKIVEGDDSGTVNRQQRTEAEKKYYITKLYGNWHISGAAINVRLFSRLGGFDLTMAQFGDTDFFARGLLAGFDDVYISRTLTYYRVVASSVSSVSVRTNRDIREIIYIIRKFRDILTRKEIRLLYKKLAQLSFRRSCRWILNPDPVNFIYCIKILFQSTVRYTLLSLS